MSELTNFDANEDFGDFGDFDVNEVQLSLEKGTYKLKVTELKEPKQKPDSLAAYRILELVIDDDNAGDFNGEVPGGIFMAYYPGMTKDDFDSMDAKAKANYRRSLATFKKVAKAFGFDAADIDKGRVDWKSVVGYEIFGDLYTDKSDNLKVNYDSITLASEVEDDIFDKFKD